MSVEKNKALVLRLFERIFDRPQGPSPRRSAGSHLHLRTIFPQYAKPALAFKRRFLALKA